MEVMNLYHHHSTKQGFWHHLIKSKMLNILTQLLFLFLFVVKISIQDNCPLTFSNKTFDLSFIARKNRTCHYVTHWSIKSQSPKLPDNIKIDVKSSVSEFGGLQTFHVQGMMIAPPSKPAGYELFSGIGYYKFYPDGVQTFQQALEICSNDGAHLAIVNSEAEANVMKEIYARYPKAKEWAYLGFHDIENEGKFFTIFGEPLSSTGYTTWHPGMPDQSQGNEDCGSIHRTGRLNDLWCDRNGPWPFFCEYDLSWEEL